MVERENETYNALLGMVRTKYKLDQILLPSEPILLTYTFPDFSDDPIGYTLPPVELKEYGDVALFMSVRLNCPWLELYVTFGDRDVDSYRCQRREEDRITMGVVARTEITITELEDELEKIRRASYALTQNRAPPPIVVSDDNDSSEDSSSPRPPNVGCMPSIGVISLQDGAPMEWLAIEPGDELAGNTTSVLDLGKAASTGDGVRGVSTRIEGERLFREGASNKYGNGSGEQHEPCLTQMGTCSATQLNLQMERDRKSKEMAEETPIIRNLAKEFDMDSSNPTNTIGKGIPTGMENRDCDILDGTDMTSKDHLFFGRIFADRDAFKLHMTLYAIANKFLFLIKKSEPMKMLLTCSGLNCAWRVYAAKIGNSPCFEIRTLESGHTCSVNERWYFRNHATSNVVGGMVRHRYGSGGGGPRPGDLRDIMMNDHSVPSPTVRHGNRESFLWTKGLGMQTHLTWRFLVI
ncbi:unnamed protein product [Brassica oleracea var. botrytis]